MQMENVTIFSYRVLPCSVYYMMIDCMKIAIHSFAFCVKIRAPAD